jgi:hypothetical protein
VRLRGVGPTSISRKSRDTRSGQAAHLRRGSADRHQRADASRPEKVRPARWTGGGPAGQTGDCPRPARCGRWPASPHWGGPMQTKLATQTVMREGGVIASDMVRHPLAPLPESHRVGLLELARELAGVALGGGSPGSAFGLHQRRLAPRRYRPRTTDVSRSAPKAPRARSQGREKLCKGGRVDVAQRLRRRNRRVKSSWALSPANFTSSIFLGRSLSSTITKPSKSAKNV